MTSDEQQRSAKRRLPEPVLLPIRLRRIVEHIEHVKSLFSYGKETTAQVYRQKKIAGTASISSWETGK
jgi:hypothetical protein